MSLALWALTASLPGAAAAGSVSLVDPVRLSADVTLSVTGTGFATAASSNSVTFTADTGQTATVTASAVSTVDAARGVRRLAIRAPQGLPAGRTRVRITNLTNNEDTDAGFVEMLTTSVSPASAAVGAGPISVVLRGSSNAQFPSAGLRVVFGSGVTVGSVQVDSPTQLTVSISVSPTATIGPRNVSTLAPGQSTVLAGGFSVVAAGPTNVAPTVTVAPVAPVTLPAGATLSATVQDDGLPNPPGAVTLAWTQQSGPAGGATFAAPAAATTGVNFSAPGTYGLRLTANDGALSAFADVTVTVNPAPPTNVAPTVTVAPVAPVTLPAGATLSATVQDDGLPNPPGAVTLAWTQQSGPAGGATFAAPAAATTGVSFSAPGTYGLRLTANDGALSAFADVTVTVNPAPPTNVAPTVNAGADQTIALPATAQLAGVVTDDGLPQGSTLTIAWARLSGPGTVTFGDAALPATTAAFSAPGTYTLRLSASDTEFIRTDDVVIVVNEASPTNAAPTVNAGADQAITLPASALLAGTVADDGLPQGAVVSSSWSKVAGPGTVVFSNAGAVNTSATFSEPGTYTLRLTASDTALTGADDVDVVVNAPSPTNAAPTVNAGPDLEAVAGEPIDLAGAVADDGRVDAAPAIAWRVVSGPGLATFASQTAAQTTVTFDAPGIYVLQLSAGDGEFVSTDDTAVAVTASPANVSDRAPPLVTLTVPLEVVPGGRIDARAEASDNVGVTGVRFEVEGQPAVDAGAAPFVATFTVPEVVAPGSTVAVRAAARDAAGNTGRASATVTVTGTPDTVPPTVQINGPAATSPGAVVRLTATAEDAVGVAAVTFLSADAEIATTATSPYVASYLVPANAAPGSAIAFTARARDFAGNTGDSVLVVPVQAEPDTTTPTVSLDVPAESFPGALLSMAATASDAGGVASVALSVDEAQVATLIAPPYTARYRVPDAQPPGTTLAVVATATDFAGFTTTATSAVRIVAPPLVTQGVVTGEVFDDTTGLPLAGARVELEGVDAAGVAFAAEATTDERGRYLLRGSAGEARLRITRDGFTRVDRAVTIDGGRAVEAFDGRLTPIVAAPSRAALVSLSGSATTGLVVVPVSGQGLQGRLPLGWSPAAAADVWPHTASIGPSTIRVANAIGMAAGTPVSVVRFDETAGGWRVVGGGSLAGNGLWIEATISAAGQYAFLVGDTLPAAPPAAVAGQMLGGVEQASLPADLVTAISPQPQILFYEPGVFSEVAGLVTSATPMTSGLPLVARITESYRFVSGDDLLPEPYEADLVFYQVRGTAATGDAQVSARFVASPSQAFEPLALERGVIAVEILAAAGPGVPRGLVTASGGVVDGPGGLQLALPAGAVSVPTPVTLAALGASPVPLPDVLTFVAGAGVAVDRALTRGGLLSLPAPAGLTDASRVVLARVATIGGQTRLVLSGTARIEGGRLVADTRVAGQATALEGVTAPGSYLFLRVADPIGYVGGVVRGVDGAALGGALVSSTSLPIVSISTALGAYLAVGRAAIVTFTARDLVRNDTGSAQAFVLANVVQAIGLRLVPVAPQVTSIAPPDGATGVALGTPIVVTFSEPIDPASVSGANLSHVLLRTAAGDPVAGAASLSVNNTTLTFRPAQALASDTGYTFQVTTGVRDVAGYALAAAVSVSFATLDTTPPATPAAGSITAGIPDARGGVTVSATQGTAGPRDRVFVDNVTRGTSAVALVNANGSFSTVIVAGLTDRLRVRIIDDSGNETVQELAEFRQTNADGSVSQVVGADGGVVDGPEGSRATIRPGTFPDGAVVTLRAVPVQAFPRQLTPEEAANFSLVRAIEVDFGGAEPRQYVDLSWPAAPGDEADDQWILTEAVFVEGRWVMNVTDTAKYRDGRITTSSPPCPGVTAAAVYGLLKSAVTYGLNYAQMYANGRYKLIAEPAVFTSSPIPIPYVVLSPELPQPVCFPVITGRVSISPNNTRVVVPSFEMTPRDRQIVITNETRGTSVTLSREVRPYEFEVSGSTLDAFRVVAVGPAGERQVPVRVNVNEAEIEGGVTNIRVRLTVDPDYIGVPVRSFRVTNLTRNREVVVPVEPPDPGMPVTGGAGPFVASIEGGVTDSLTVEAIPLAVPKPKVPGPLDQRRALSGWTQSASPEGSGNLVIRATPGTIDPSRAELIAAGRVGDPARTRVVLTSTDGLDITLWDESPNPRTPIVDGGFRYSFDGDPEARYTLTVFYDSRPPFSVNLPHVAIVVRNLNTQDIIKRIFGPAPPRDEPVELPAIQDDSEAPVIVSAPSAVQSFDPSGLIQFRFSEAMNPASLKNGITVVDANGDRVAGEIRVSEGNRLATFVPRSPLRLGQTYEIRLLGRDEAVGNGAPGAIVADLAGNGIAATKILRVRTFSPRSIGIFAGPDGRAVPFKDVAVLKKRTGDDLRTYLVATTGASGDNLLVLDATDPIHLVSGTPESPDDPLGPRVVGRQTDGISRQGVAVASDVRYRLGGQDVTGDVAVTLRFNVDESASTFVDLRALPTPSALASKVLTRRPELTQRPGSVPANAYARTIVTLPLQGGMRGFAAVERVGLMVTDLQTAIAGQQRESLLPNPGLVDVAAASGALYAISKGAAPLLQIVGPNLDPLADDIRLPGQPVRVRAASGVLAAINAAGDKERITVAVVGGQGAIWFYKTGDPSGRVNPAKDYLPELLATLPVAGTVRDVEIDAARSRVFAAVNENAGGQALYAIDLLSIVPAGAPVIGSDGLDGRVMMRKGYGQGVNGMRLDQERGLLYIATPAGLDVWILADNCCDLGVDFTQDEDEAATSGATADVLRRELNAIKRGVVLGLDRAAAKCNVDIRQIKLIESGSSGCLWAQDPVAACGTNYQPGVSDHDISTFMPDEWYTGALVDDPNWTGDPADTPQMLRAGCVAAALSYSFVDPYTNEPKEIEGVEFGDISFITNWVSDFDTTLYRLKRTIPGLPGDADNDLGMGRQLLVMKHLTEAYGVDVRGARGARAIHESVYVSEREFEDKFRLYRTQTKIPELEGYEWSVLMEFLLAKAKAYVRIKGASDPASQFHKTYVKQYHTAGKAGIRAAAARMVAYTAARDLLLNVRRGDPLPGEPVDPPGILIFRRNACIVYEKDLVEGLALGSLTPGSIDWKAEPCGSMEEYIASSAIRTLTLPPGQQPFTPQEVAEVVRFFRVKADLEPIRSEQQADAFIASVHNFIARTKAVAHPIYAQQVQLETGERRADREDNRRWAEGLDLSAPLPVSPGGRLKKVLEDETKLHLTPRVTNRGFRNAPNQPLRMYRVAPGGNGPAELVCPVATDPPQADDCAYTLNLSGGEEVFVKWQRKSDNSLVLDQNEDAIPIFRLPINQNASFGQLGHVAFTIGLPADGEVREAERENNVGGFFYYILDPAEPQAPGSPAGGLPSPVPLGQLRGDPECSPVPELRVTQSMEVKGRPVTSSPVILYIGQKATLNVTLHNPNPGAIEQARVCSTLTAECYDVGTVPGNGSTTKAVPFSSPSSITKDAIATAFAPDAGFAASQPLSVVVNCEPKIVSFALDPNPSGPASRVMRGGKAIRYFATIDPNTGEVATDVTATFRVAGIGAQQFTFQTNADGVLGSERRRVTSDGQTVTAFDEGIAIPFVDYVGRNGSEATVNLVLVNGRPPTCGAPILFSVFVDPLDTTYQFEGGGAIKAGFSLFKRSTDGNGDGDGGSGSVELGGSYTLRLFHRGNTPTISESGIYRVDWERKAAFNAAAALRWKGFNADAEFGSKGAPGERNLFGKSKAEAFGGSGEISGRATQAYRYTFPGPPSGWSADQATAFAALLFPSIAESDAEALLKIANTGAEDGNEDPTDYSGNFTRSVLRQAVEPLVASEDVYKTYRSARIGALTLFGEGQITGFDGTMDLDIRKAENTGPPQTAVTDDQGNTDAGVPAPEAAPSKGENETKPVFSAQANLSGEITLTYERVDQLKHEIGDPRRANPNAIAEKVVGSIQTLSFDGKYDASSAMTFNFQAVKDEIDTPNTIYVQEPQVVKDRAKAGLDWLAERLSKSEAGKFDRGLVFRLHSRVEDENAPTPKWTPWRLEIVFRGPKEFGFVDEEREEEEGVQYSLTFAVEGEARVNRVIAEIFDQAQAFRVLLAERERERVAEAMRAFGYAVQGRLLPEPGGFDANKLYAWFLKFVRAVLIYGGRPAVSGEDATTSFPEFFETVKKGKADETDWKIGATLRGASFNATVQPFKLDSALSYRLTRGVVVRGKPVVLEDYGDVPFGVAENPKEILLRAIDRATNGWSTRIYDWFRRGQQKEQAPAGESGGSVGNANASLRVASNDDFNATRVGRIDFRTVEAGAAPLPSTPLTFEGRAGRPRYGVGGYHFFDTTRASAVFDASATLTVTYDQGEVDGFDESSLRLFRYTGNDWALLPATLDLDANRVTATIDRAGIYTLGALMPAGRLTWTVTGVNRSGTGNDLRTEVALESVEAVRLNDLTPAPAGTLFHVWVLNDEGGFVSTPDASPALADVQVAAGADGKVRVTVSLTGAPLMLNLGVFSEVGTVDGFADIVLPVQP